MIYIKTYKDFIPDIISEETIIWDFTDEAEDIVLLIFELILGYNDDYTDI